MEVLSCEYCETLDLADLLTGNSESLQPGESYHSRLMRYYCKNPECGLDYCPFNGKSDKCPHLRD